MVYKWFAEILRAALSTILGLVQRVWTPEFLRDLEPYFLLNRPRFWVSKPYCSFYHALLITLVCVPIALIYPIRPHQIVTILLIVFSHLLVQFALFLNWANRTLQYNIEREYGNSTKLQGWLEVLIYMLCIVLIVAPSFFSFSIMKTRVAKLTDRNELVEHIAQYQALRKEGFDASGAVTCTDAIEERNSDFQFDFESIGKFTGKTITSDEQAEIYYCSAMIRIDAIHDFAYEKSSLSQQILYVSYLITIIGGGWFVFSCKLSRERPGEYFYNLFGLILFYVILYGMVWGGLSILSHILPSGWLEIDNTAVLAVYVWFFSFLVLLDIVSIDRLGKYSSLSSINLAFFPVAVILSSFMLSAWFGNGNPPSVFIGIATIVCFLPIPYLKGQFIKLLAQPEDE